MVPTHNAVDRQQQISAVPMFTHFLRAYQALDVSGRSIVRNMAARVEDEFLTQSERDEAAKAIVDTLFPTK